MSKAVKESSLIPNDLTTIIPAIVNLQKLSLTDWCKKNNWSRIQSVQLQFYAIPPGGYVPVPLPKEAFALSDEYQQVFEALLELQLLERIGRWDLNKALILNIACIPILFIKNFLKSSNVLANVPVVIYQLLDLSVAMLLITTVVYFCTSLFSYWQHYRCKKKLSGMPGFIDLIASLEKKNKED